MTTAFLTRKTDSVSCLYYVEGRVSDMSNDKWFCSKCGTQNSGNFCSECGAQRKTDEPVTCTCGFVYTGNFCTNCGAPRPQFQSSVNKGDRPLTDTAPAIGWTCSKCGKENQTGEFCDECGEKIKKVELFSCSSYQTCNPPKYESATVYEYSDTELICVIFNDGKTKYKLLPKDIAGTALNIIKEYGIDKWKDYENINNPMMGGSVSVMYRDGDKMVGSTMDHMGSAVTGACWKLMLLFNGN